MTGNIGDYASCLPLRLPMSDIENESAQRHPLTLHQNNISEGTVSSFWALGPETRLWRSFPLLSHPPRAFVRAMCSF